MFGSVTGSATRAPSELVIGLVGAVGTDLDLVATDLQIALRAHDFDSEEVRLSALLADLQWTEDLPAEPLDRHIWTHMDAGNKLRLSWNRGEAMALLALTEIAAIREEKNAERSAAPTESLERFAYILRSLKHPKEVELLRAVYGTRFLLISAYAPRSVRKAALEAHLTKDYRSDDDAKWSFTADELIARDESETQPAPEPFRPPAGTSSDSSSDDEEGPSNDVDKRVWGQNLRDTFHRADFFVDAREDVGLRAAVERVVEILFGHPSRTPNKDEYALFAAEGAARRSAELGRQVGAAIATPDGDVIALGTNEVPAAGGGLYWEPEAFVEPACKESRHRAATDAREFQNDVETNDRMKREIGLEIVDELTGAGFLRDGAGETDAPALLAALERTRLGDLIEFGRATHAEMAALSDAVRRGVPVAGATLYTTTFPCHNCARHIIAAGIQRVVYVAPYAKSLAKELHGDAIDVASATPREGAVQFEPFVGVAPRRYLDLFEAGTRKEADGTVVRHIPSEAVPKIPDVEPDDLRPAYPEYRQREDLALDLLKEVFEKTGLAFQPDEGGKT